MKNIILTLLLAILSALSALADTTEKPQDIQICVSPFMAASDRAAQFKLLQGFIIASSPNGCHISIWDGYQMRMITDLHLNQLNYDSAAARLPRVAPALAALKEWFASLDTLNTSVAMKDSGAIKFPQWIRAVAAQPAVGSRVIVVMASPLFLSEREPTFSMIGPNSEPLYPSDAHLTRTIAETPYAAPHGLITGVQVLWAYPNESVWKSDYHRHLITRWWALWVESAGGRLTSLSCDMAHVLSNSLQENPHPLGEFAVNPTDSTLLVMHFAAEREVPIDLPPAKPKPSLVPITQRVLSPPPPQPPKVEPVSKPPVAPAPSLVTLDVGVTDAAGSPVSGLSKADFVVHEDGVKQDITTFSTDRKPISLVILIDVSGSIGSKLNKIRAAASTIIHQAGEQDEFAVIKFTSSSTVIQPFTSDAVSADHALDTLNAGGDTALLDALGFALDYAGQNGKNPRRGIVLITDGGENGSKSTTRADVVTLLQKGNVQFYAVGFPEGLGQGQSPDTRGRSQIKSQPTEALARNLLDTLAQVSSGGRVFYPHQVSELNRIADTITSDLRTPRYTLGYYATRPQSDAVGWRSVQVLVHSSAEHGLLTAHTRAGYFASQPNHSQPAVFSNTP